MMMPNKILIRLWPLLSIALFIFALSSSIVFGQLTEESVYHPDHLWGYKSERLLNKSDSNDITHTGFSYNASLNDTSLSESIATPVYYDKYSGGSAPKQIVRLLWSASPDSGLTASTNVIPLCFDILSVDFKLQPLFESDSLVKECHLIHDVSNSAVSGTWRIRCSVQFDNTAGDYFLTVFGGQFNKQCTGRQSEHYKSPNSKTELVLITHQRHSGKRDPLTIQAGAEQIPPAAPRPEYWRQTEKENTTTTLTIPFSSSGAEDIPLNEATGGSYGSQNDDMPPPPGSGHFPDLDMLIISPEVFDEYIAAHPEESQTLQWVSEPGANDVVIHFMLHGIKQTRRISLKDWKFLLSEGFIPTPFRVLGLVQLLESGKQQKKNLMEALEFWIDRQDLLWDSPGPEDGSDGTRTIIRGILDELASIPPARLSIMGLVQTSYEQDIAERTGWQARTSDRSQFASEPEYLQALKKLLMSLIRLQNLSHRYSSLSESSVLFDRDYYAQFESMSDIQSALHQQLEALSSEYFAEILKQYLERVRQEIFTGDLATDSPATDSPATGVEYQLMCGAGRVPGIISCPQDPPRGQYSSGSGYQPPPQQGSPQYAFSGHGYSQQSSRFLTSKQRQPPRQGDSSVSINRQELKRIVNESIDQNSPCDLSLCRSGESKISKVLGVECATGKLMDLVGLAASIPESTLERMTYNDFYDRRLCIKGLVVPILWSQGISRSSRIVENIEGATVIYDALANMTTEAVINLIDVVSPVSPLFSRSLRYAQGHLLHSQENSAPDDHWWALHFFRQIRQNSQHSLVLTSTPIGRINPPPPAPVARMDYSEAREILKHKNKNNVSKRQLKSAVQTLLKFSNKFQQTQIIDHIGSGGNGIVFKVLYNNKYYALKFVRYSLKKDAQERVRRVTDFINHSDCHGSFRCIIEDYELSEAHNYFFQLMPLVDTTLKEVMAHGPMGWESLRDRYFIPLLHQLIALHRLNYYHRDIKPANVGIREGQVYLLDLDELRRVESGELDQGLTSLMVGTVGFSSRQHAYSVNRKMEIPGADLSGTNPYVHDCGSVGHTWIALRTGIIAINLYEQRLYGRVNSKRNQQDIAALTNRFHEELITNNLLLPSLFEMAGAEFNEIDERVLDLLFNQASFGQNCLHQVVDVLMSPKGYIPEKTRQLVREISGADGYLQQTPPLSPSELAAGVKQLTLTSEQSYSKQPYKGATPQHAPETASRRLSSGPAITTPFIYKTDSLTRSDFDTLKKLKEGHPERVYILDDSGGYAVAEKGALSGLELEDSELANMIEVEDQTIKNSPVAPTLSSFIPQNLMSSVPPSQRQKSAVSTSDTFPAAPPPPPLQPSTLPFIVKTLDQRAIEALISKKNQHSGSTFILNKDGNFGVDYRGNRENIELLYEELITMTEFDAVQDPPATGLIPSGFTGLPPNQNPQKVPTPTPDTRSLSVATGTTSGSTVAKAPPFGMSVCPTCKTDMSVIPAKNLPAGYPLQNRFFALCDGCQKPLQSSDYPGTSQTSSSHYALHCIQCGTDFCCQCVNAPTLCLYSFCGKPLTLVSVSELFVDMILDNPLLMGQKIWRYCHSCMKLLIRLTETDTREVGRRPCKRDSMKFIATVLSNSRQSAMIWHCQKFNHDFCNSCVLQKRVGLQPVDCEAHRDQWTKPLLGWAYEEEYCFNCRGLLPAGEVVSICSYEHGRNAKNRPLCGKAHAFDCKSQAKGTHSAKAGAGENGVTAMTSGNKIETNDNLNICQICFVGKVDAVILPCGHAKSCKACIKMLADTKTVRYRCPFCNRDIESIKSIYL